MPIIIWINLNIMKVNIKVRFSFSIYSLIIKIRKWKANEIVNFDGSFYIIVSIIFFLQEITILVKLFIKCYLYGNHVFQTHILFLGLQDLCYVLLRLLSH